MTTRPDNRRVFTDAQLVAAIRRLSRANGYPPSVRELAAEFDASAPTIHAHLRRLNADGKVTWTKNHPRTLKVVPRQKQTTP